MPGLLRGIARTAIVAGTATRVSNNVTRRQSARWSQQEAQEAPQAPPPSAATDRLAQLRELGELKQQGILTDEEFALQKARILA